MNLLSSWSTCVWGMGQRMNVSNCVLWSTKIYSMPCTNYRYNRSRNNVRSTAINHIIWLSTAEEIDSLHLSAISYCACEVERKYTMNMWPPNKVCCKKSGRNHLKFQLYTETSYLFQNFKYKQFSQLAATSSYYTVFSVVPKISNNQWEILCSWPPYLYASDIHVLCVYSSYFIVT